MGPSSGEEEEEWVPPSRRPELANVAPHRRPTGRAMVRGARPQPPRPPLRRPARPLLTIFAREVVVAGKEEAPLPYLVYLQGGPRYGSPRPTEVSGWVKKACEEYRVLLLDQRGTGLSTPLTTSSLSQITSAAEQAEYLKNFRADNIVKDTELIRRHIVPDAKPWTILG